MLSPSVWLRSPDMPAINLLASVERDSSVCSRENANSPWVSAASIRGLRSGANGVKDPRIVGLQTPLKNIEAADNNAEHIVEVMSDAAGKLAELTLLGCARECFLRLLVFGDVLSESCEAE
jgi:hypothetical protein